MENIISMGTLYLNGRPVGAQTACPEDIQDIRLGDTVPGKELSFVLVNGVLVANNSVMLDVPFEVLRASHLVRARAVVIDGSNYRCRLLRTDNDENDADEWDQALIATGANRKLWNLYDNEPFWTVSPHGMEVRGGHGDPEGRYAWRPVLEPFLLNFSRLRKGGMVIAGGGNSLFHALLHDVKLIAARPVMHTVSFADLQELNLVHGYEVSIDGQWYQIRMLMDLDEWLLALEAVGEDDHIWHWEQCQSFLQQPSGNGLRVLCTDSRRLDQPDMVMRTDRRQQTGWRPVLELARKPDFQKLEVGQKLLCWGWQSLVNGILLENGTYDLVLQRQDGTDISPKDTATFASPAMDDQVIVNKSAVAGLRRKEK